MDIYLDIETNWAREITIIGVYERSRGVLQWVKPNIVRAQLIRQLPADGRLFTFNGHCFDLPIIKNCLGVDLRAKYKSVDLRFVCAAAGLHGGQKAIEQELNLPRQTEGLDGLDAMRLWSRWWHHQDEIALKTLLQYNQEDLLNMVRIQSELRKRGRLP